MIDRLYDDHQTNDSPTQTGPVTTTTTAGERQQMQTTATGEQAEPGGLDASSSTSGQNPVAAAVEASTWTHDDLAVMLSALSIVAWVATTIYVQRSI